MSANVEIKLKLSDQASAGLKAVAQQTEKTASTVAAKQKRANTETANSYQKLHYETVASFQKTANARELLGVKSEYKVRAEIRATQEAYRQLAKSGELSSKELARAYDAQIGKVKALKNEMGELTKSQKLSNALAIGGGLVAGGMVTKSVLANPLRSYADLESAQTDLQIALMQKGGKVSDAYDVIMKQATDLAGKLPGSTKDFVAAATALKEQGMTEKSIYGGGLTASAQFGVITGMDQYQSATTIAKVREAYGLGGNDLPEAANLMQKGRFAFGIAPQDYLAVAAYAAPVYNQLGLTGIENTKDLFAAQGLGASKGLENTSFGTNFSMMLLRTAQIDSRINGKSQEAKEVKAMLDEYGIDMNFFDKKGKFAGAKNMVAQLEKLKPLSDQDRIRVLNKMFGVEAARPASILVDEGLAGFLGARKRLDDQADMQDRIDTKTKSYDAKKESAAGAWESTKSSAARPLGEAMKGVFDTFGNVLTDKVNPTIEKHPGLGTGGLLATAIGLGLPASIAATQGLKSVLGTGMGVRMISAIPGITKAAGVMSKVPLIPKGAGAFGLAASIGGAALSSVYGEESAAARYGSAALSGAGLGATIGSVIPGVGTVVGGAVGGGLGLIAQGISELLKKDAKAPEPAMVDTKLTIGLPPGFVVTSQTTQTGGAVRSQVNTGNIMNGVM